MWHRVVGHSLEQAAGLGAGLDWKTSVQEAAARAGLGPPQYVVQGTGPDHDRTFTAVLLLEGAEWGRGYGKSKKIAEQDAAARAHAALLQEYAEPPGA